MSKPDYTGTYHVVEQDNMDAYLAALGNISRLSYLPLLVFRRSFEWTFILKDSSWLVESNAFPAMFAECWNACNGVDHLYVQLHRIKPPPCPLCDPRHPPAHTHAH